MRASLCTPALSNCGALKPFGSALAAMIRLPRPGSSSACLCNWANIPSTIGAALGTIGNLPRNIWSSVDKD